MMKPRKTAEERSALRYRADKESYCREPGCPFKSKSTGDHVGKRCLKMSRVRDAMIRIFALAGLLVFLLASL